MSANNTGVLGIEYEEVSKVVNDSDNDWMKFIKDDSDGLTKTDKSYYNRLSNRTFIAC